MTLQRKVADSSRITLLATVATALTQAVVLAVLARLLSPAEFGIVAAALVIVKPVQQLLFNGIEQAGVLQTDLRRNAISSLFRLSLGAALLGMIGLSAIACLAPLAANFRNTIIGLAFILLGSALAVAPRILLRRELAFGRLALAETMGVVIGFGVFAITAAYAGLGSSSLIYGYVGRALVRAIICLILCPDALKWGAFDLGALRPTLAMGFRITGVSMLEIVEVQTAPAFVGAWFGTAALGQFSQANALITLPIQLVAMSMSLVASTGFRVARDDPATLRQACHTLVETASAITLPLCFGIAAAAGPIVAVLAGPQWTPAAALVPWLALGAACSVLGHLLAVANEAAGLLREKFLIQLITLGVLALALRAAVQSGLEPAAQATAFSALVYLAGQSWLARRLLQGSFGEMARWTMPGCLAGAAVLAVILAIEHMAGELPQAVRLGLDMATAAIVLLGLYAIFYPVLLRTILALVLPTRNRERAAS